MDNSSDVSLGVFLPTFLKHECFQLRSWDFALVVSSIIKSTGLRESRAAPVTRTSAKTSQSVKLGVLPWKLVVTHGNVYKSAYRVKSGAAEVGEAGSDPPGRMWAELSTEQRLALP